MATDAVVERYKQQIKDLQKELDYYKTFKEKAEYRNEEIVNKFRDLVLEVLSK